LTNLAREKDMWSVLGSTDIESRFRDGGGFFVPKIDYQFLNKELSIHAISRVDISLVSQKVN